MTKRKVRWGILGAARINARVMPAIVAADNAELVAIASRRKGAAQQVLSDYLPQVSHVTAYDDPALLIARDDIEVIYLPMANEEHTEWALKAIAAGKHVLIEKPLAMAVAEIDEIQLAAKQHQVQVMEGFMYCFHPQHRQVQQFLAEGNLGDVRTVRSCFSFPMPEARHYRIQREMANGGGAMWDIGPYAIHTIRQWFDAAPLSVMAMASLNEFGADMGMTGTIDYGAGRYGQFDISFERARRSQYEIIGTRGGLRCDTVWQGENDPVQLYWWNDEGKQGEIAVEAANHFIEEITAFSQCIIDGKPPLLSLDDARENCQVIVAAVESSHTGQRVRIKS